jgi:hypothetical protein
LVVNHIGLPAEIKRVSPSTFVVWRRVFGADDPSPEARGWPPARWWWDYLGGVPAGADAIQGANEWFIANDRPAQEFTRLRDWLLAWMDICTAYDTHTTYLDLAPGHLEMNQFEVLRPVFAQAEKQGHLLNYHAYSSDKFNWDMTVDARFFALRWVPWVKDYPRLRVLLGEAGSYNSPRFRDAGTTVAMMRQLQGLLAPYPQVIGAAWWTLGGEPGGWGADDWQVALGAYEAFTTAR